MGLSGCGSGDLAAKSCLKLAAPFCVALTILGYLLLRLPSMPEDQRQFIKFPKTLADLKALGSTLSIYKGICYWRILLTITLIYIFLQSFMIPGSVLFSILLGFLFPTPLALFCSAVGASCCYILADFVGTQTVAKLFPEQIATCRKVTGRFQSMSGLAIFFFRLSPIIPNWLVNICSPVLGVPLSGFFWGTFFGVVPLSLFFVKAGTILQELTDIGVTSVASVYTLAFFALVSFLPFAFTRICR
ncbi:Transmembrane protein 41B [Sparganum proliferum]